MQNVIYLTEQEQKDYIAASGQFCPICKSHDLSGDFFQVDGGVAWQEVTCNECEAEWVDEYDLSRICRVLNVKNQSA